VMNAIFSIKKCSQRCFHMLFLRSHFLSFGLLWTRNKLPSDIFFWDRIHETPTFTTFYNFFQNISIVINHSNNFNRRCCSLKFRIWRLQIRNKMSTHFFLFKSATNILRTVSLLIHGISSNIRILKLRSSTKQF
jgi:hypothetical protein